MKQQILVIHGGDTFEKYSDYLSYLKNKKIDLDKFRKRGWKDNLGDNLGDKYDVLFPRMPNSNNAKYIEWKIWFERILPLLKNELILIGHSLGGLFLVKYLSENKINNKIKSLLLISTPFDDEEDSTFNLTFPLLNFSEQCPNIYLIHSKDDVGVNFDQLLKYKEQLPLAKEVVFEDKGHFNQETFPEIIKLIKEIK